MNAGSIWDVAVIGGGIVGLAVTRSLCERFDPSRITVLEAEPRLARHQSGRNSGVIHSGIYYEPGSDKARLCVDGRERLVAFCREEGVAVKRCGKLIVATRKAEIDALTELERRGAANGLEEIERLDGAGLREHEPHVRGEAGLFVPQTGVVDFAEIVEAIARGLKTKGVEIRTGARVRRVVRRDDGFELECRGGKVQARGLINCAGLQSDRVARMCGLDPGLRIVPFKGEYFNLVPERRGLVRNLIYPVPDRRLPFLGVHLTRTIHGDVHAGPNALLALGRGSYGRFRPSPRDLAETLGYGGFRRLARRYWKTGAGELLRSLSRVALARQLRAMVPELTEVDLQRAGTGIRAQAVEPDGRLVDDFRVIEQERMVHVLNAPSPAATASLAIGVEIASRAAESLRLA